MITIPKSSFESKLRCYFIIGLFVIVLTAVMGFANLSTKKIKDNPLNQVVKVSPNVDAGYNRTKMILKPLPQIVPPVSRMLMIRG